MTTLVSTLVRSFMWVVVGLSGGGGSFFYEAFVIIKNPNDKHPTPSTTLSPVHR